MKAAQNVVWCKVHTPAPVLKRYKWRCTFRRSTALGNVLMWEHTKHICSKSFPFIFYVSEICWSL